MKNNTKNLLLTVLRFLPFTICIVCLCIYLLSGEKISAESLSNFAPENPLYAAVFMVLLYAFKSLTVFFPIAVLNILGGLLFAPKYALLINSIGILAELTVSYWMGRVSGTELDEKLRAKYPKIGEMLEKEENDSFFLAFLLHVVFFLPGDAVSMCFGARKMPFFTFLISSFLGTLPGMIATTLLGSNITDPTSPVFWLFVGLIIGISAVSVLLYYIWKKIKSRNQSAENNVQEEKKDTDMEETCQQI